MSERVADGRSGADVTGVRLEPYVAAVLRHRWLIIGMAICGTVIGLVLALMRPPVFEARATVVINRQTDDDAPSDLSKAARAFLTSQGVAAQVLSEIGLDRAPHSLAAATFLRDHVTLDDIVPGAMLQVRVRLADPALATKVCSRLIALVIELSGRMRAEENLAGQEFIKRQLDSSRQRLDELEGRLLAFKTQSQVDLQQDDVQAMLEGRRELVDLAMRMAAERGRLAAAESELARRAGERHAQSESEPDSTKGVKAAPNSSMRDRRRSSRSAPSLMTRSTEDDTSTAGRTWATDRFEGMHDLLDYEAASSRVRLAALESRRRELVETLGLTRPTVEQLTELYKRELEQARLQAEYDVSAKLYQDLLTRYEQVRIQVASGGTEMKLIDPAITATNVSRPLASLAAALGGGAGLVAGILLAFAFASFRTPRQTATLATPDQ